MTRRSLILVLAAGALAAGCSHALDVTQFPTSVSLFDAGVAKYRDRKWTDAITAFERLTLDLSTRDTLLGISHWYLAQSRVQNGERLLAAQAFIRLGEVLPDDTLADDAVFAAGRSYAQLWRRPTLDPQYGLLSQTQYRLLLAIYPDSPFGDSARVELRRLDNLFAKKDYDTGLHYVRRKAYDSAILYFKDVVKNWPESDVARLSMLRLVDVYRHPLLKYEEDAAEVCGALRAAYPTDVAVLAACKIGVADTTSTR